MPGRRTRRVLSRFFEPLLRWSGEGDKSEGSEGGLMVFFLWSMRQGAGLPGMFWAARLWRVVVIREFA